MPAQQHRRCTDEDCKSQRTSWAAVAPQDLLDLVSSLQPLQLLDLALKKDTAIVHRLFSAGIGRTSSAKHAEVRDGPPCGEALGWVRFKEETGCGNKSFQVKRAWQLAEDTMEHFGFVARSVEELQSSRADDGGEHVHAEDRFAGEEHIKKARNLAQSGDVMRIHRKCPRQSKEGFRCR